MFQNIKKALLITVCLSVSTIGLSGFATSPTSKRYTDQELKHQAKVISRLFNVVKWSDDVLAEKTFNYCQLGNSDDDQNKFVKQINFHKHDIRVIQINDIKQADGKCHSVFLYDVDSENLEPVLSYFKNKPILLISNETDFARNGGHVSLFQINDKFAFTLNIPSLEESGFEVDLSDVNEVIVEPLPGDI